MVRPPKPGLREHVSARLRDHHPPPARDESNDADQAAPAHGSATAVTRRVSGVGSGLAGWVRAAPAERLPVPVGAAVYGASALAHAAEVPAWGAITAGAGVCLATYGQAVKRTGSEDRALKIALLPAAATGWIATAAELGVVGPHGALSWAYLGLYGAAYGAYRLDSATRGRIAWRRQRTDWHRIAPMFGLRGSHLLDREPTRLGERLVVDVKGTGKRASMIASSDIAERIAEYYGLRASRVKVREGAIAGRVVITIRYRNPWSDAILHPLFDDEPEIELAEQADMCQPLVVGMDPEAGRPLTISLWTPDGGQNSIVVSMKRGGKTVLLNDLLERQTSAVNCSPWGISTAKGKVIRRWAPALELAAYGRDQRARALRMLELACKAIHYRETMSDRPTLQPTRDHPLIVINMDEMSAQLGTHDQIAYASREAMSYINSKGGSEGVVSVLAGQRGTQSHIGDTDIRTQVDNLAIGKVSRQTEMSNVAGELGFELPNMARYGEGYAGVWCLATVDGDYSLGRTFFLDDFDQIEELAEDREPTPLEPGLVEHLGDQYLRLKYGDDALTTTLRTPQQGQRDGQPPQAPASSDFLSGLDEDLEANMPPDLRKQLDEINNKLSQAKKDLGAVDLPPPPDPEMAAKYQEAAAQRHDQAAAQEKPVPQDARDKIIALLGEAGSASTGEIRKHLGISATTAWRYLSRLRLDGVVEPYGQGRGARWRLTNSRGSAPQSDTQSP